MTRVGARGWGRILWAWWAVITGLGCLLILMAFFNSALFELKSQEVQIATKVERLRQVFAPLRDRQVSLPLGVMNTFGAGELTYERLSGLRLEGAPFFKFYYAKADGHPVLARDHEDPLPAWMLARMAQFHFDSPGSLGAVRPDPRHGVPVAGEPESYLLWFGRDNRGELFVEQVDLDYIFGPWLKSQLHEVGLDDARTTLLTPKETWKINGTPDMHVVERSRIMGSPALHSGWVYYIATFFPDDKSPFQKVRLEVNSDATLDKVMHAFGLGLLAFLAVMLSFAATIFVATRTTQRELALAQARSNFTAMVSHELKTPVAAIRLYGEILVNKLVDDPAKVDEYHQTIMDESARLQRLIENLLDLGKIERGARTYELASLDANRMVEEAIAQALAAHPADARYTLERDLAPDLPPILADRDAARQAIANLVHNALKYGGEPPEMLVRTRQVGNSVEVEVLDRGPGIPVTRRKSIFEPYVRLENEARRETQGTGLGLALVKGYMDGQGGSVAVDDRPGGGSTFRLHFPIADMSKK